MRIRTIAITMLHGVDRSFSHDGLQILNALRWKAMHFGK
jgi:hypothetical protein